MSQTQLSSPIEITGTNFSELVLQSEVPVLLDFWASWCVPCNLMKRSVEKAAGVLGETVRLGLVNVDQQPEIVTRFSVQGTPAFVLVQNGQVVQTFNGMMTASGLANRVKQALQAN